MEHSEARRDLTLEFWMEISKLLPPSPVILDLGSHGMEEAQILLPMLAGHARWHGFEANPECCHNIRRTVLPRLDRRATVVLNETAVSHSVGTATLYRSKKSGWSTVDTIVFYPKAPTGHGVPSLDDL
jgi:hypothetical protein